MRIIAQTPNVAYMTLFCLVRGRKSCSGGAHGSWAGIAHYLCYLRHPRMSAIKRYQPVVPAMSHFCLFSLNFTMLSRIYCLLMH